MPRPVKSPSPEANEKRARLPLSLRTVTGLAASAKTEPARKGPASKQRPTVAPPPEQLALELAPLPRSSIRPFRTELTIEQNSLFVGNNYQGEFFVRESVVRHPESGEEILRRMTVGKLHDADRARGVLRQVHQDAYFKVLELWGAQGYSLGTVRGKRYGIVRASAYELVMAIFGGHDNARAYRRTRELLRDLQAVPIVLENISTWAGMRDREEFTLLGDVTWSEKMLDEAGMPTKGGKSSVTILLSSMVTEGFLASHYKVLLGQPYDALGSPGRGRRSEIARLIYPFLDAQLATRTRFEASLDSLAERFGLHRYQHRSKRKEKFEPAVRALSGKPILEGKFALQLVLLERNDDYVLQASRVARPSL